MSWEILTSFRNHLPHLSEFWSRTTDEIDHQGELWCWGGVRSEDVTRLVGSTPAMKNTNNHHTA